MPLPARVSPRRHKDFDHQHLLRSGFRQTRIVEIDFQVGLLKTKKTLEHVVVGISCLDACFMYGTGDRILFVSGSARFHRHGEQWHESLPMIKDGRAGHSGLTERPILNELKVIVAEGTSWRESGRIQRRTPGSAVRMNDRHSV